MKNFKFITLLILFLSLTTFNPFKDKGNNSGIFKINKLIISGNSILNQNRLKNDLSFLIGKNLTFVNNKDIDQVLNRYKLIKSASIKKVYPGTIKIQIIEDELIAVLQNKKNKFYITKNRNLINIKDILKAQNLPIVFGNKKNFMILYKTLEEIKFPIQKIKKYLFFKIGRWDIILQDKKVIKLPQNDYKSSLRNFLNIMINYDMEEKMIFDYRIKDQLILK